MFKRRKLFENYKKYISTMKPQVMRLKKAMKLKN